jgi:hypothetical protein
VWLEGLGKLKEIHLIGTRTRDFSSCSIVPQPTTLLRALNTQLRTQTNGKFNDIISADENK